MVVPITLLLVLFFIIILATRLAGVNISRAKEDEKQALIALNNSISVIGSTLELHQVLEAILDEVNTLFGASMSVLYRFDEKEGHLTLVSYRGFSYVNPPAGKIKLGEFISGKAPLEKRVVSANQLPAGLNTPPYQSIKSIMAAPLIYRDKVTGVLTTYYQQKKNFSPEEEKRLSIFAEHAAIAIEHAWLYAQSLHLQEKSKEIAILEERNRIAREIHDSLSQSLCSLAFLTEAGRAACAQKGPQKVNELLMQMKEITMEAQRDLRGLIFELQPQSLVEKGLVFALTNLVDQFKSGQNSIEVDFQIYLSKPLAANMELGLYRIAQEALTNIRKYSKATKVIIWLEEEEGWVSLKIEDNGIGFEPGQEAKGGLLNIEERIKGLKGKLNFWSQPGRGTKIHVRVPLEVEGSEEAETDNC